MRKVGGGVPGEVDWGLGAIDLESAAMFIAAGQGSDWDEAFVLLDRERSRRLEHDSRFAGAVRGKNVRHLRGVHRWLVVMPSGGAPDAIRGRRCGAAIVLSAGAVGEARRPAHRQQVLGFRPGQENSLPQRRGIRRTLPQRLGYSRPAPAALRPPGPWGTQRRPRLVIHYMHGGFSHRTRPSRLPAARHDQLVRRVRPHLG